MTYNGKQLSAEKGVFLKKKKNKLRNTEKEKKIIDSQGEINRSSSIFSGHV